MRGTAYYQNTQRYRCKIKQQKLDEEGSKQ